MDSDARNIFGLFIESVRYCYRDSSQNGQLQISYGSYMISIRKRFGYRLTAWETSSQEKPCGRYGTAYFLKHNNGPLKQGDRNPGHHAAQILGKIWSLPTTIIGLAWGGLGYAIDRAGALFGRQPQMEITWDNNAMQFANHPLMITAITLGNTISYGRLYGPQIVGPEEFWHTFQAQQLGPLYLPSNILGMAAGLAITLDTHGWINWNERGPHWQPPRTWR